MKTIIFIGTNKSGSSREATRAAEKMGFFTVLFTNNEKQLQQRRAYPDIHKMILIDTSKIEDMKDEIYKLTKSGLEIKTIVSFVDPYVHIASILCDEFCDNYTSSTAIEMMEDKEKTRNYLKNQSYSPKFFLIKPHESVPTNLEFPLIVKSPKSTGSKDVLLAKDSSQLNNHLRYLRNKNLGETIMIEEYIDGPQYLVEAIVYKRQPHVIGIVEQEITQGKRFIITGYGVLVKAPSDIQAGLEEVLQSIVTIFNIENGALHLELRLTKNGWKLIEINPRISGGAMNNMIFAAFGFNLVEETLKLLLGEPPNIQPRHKKFVYTKYVIVESKGILERVIGRTRASKSPGVVDVYVKPRRGTLLTPPLSMGHRYAYVIAEGTTLSEAKQNAVNAAKEIKFILKVA
ncbi:ATP-grasp domain-containing protein [Lysinibacillus pakistanensis]|uniref:ATP-grasp domain-containing protein n=1 Tax=Lysinibacillus pakistanensis TaxID=759811 RepID=A0AAX3X453_9BACI|nr:ATP-grasp domain-containing protein [Lysinibacillus pakistanensis]MDM5233043.1 ATP-grasp domain-containing protein [Lysinibacillus pakistanensis]WHY49152.1 ATP-grasp domain-containing protein [Lysinibacillus pakistanensis]WHY54162.1 ATP-grasp domain-containing protein [Lysinibacillus pakistanensis]